MARAKIKGTDPEKLIKQVMKTCEFNRNLAKTYIRKNEATEAFQEAVKHLRAKADAKTARPAKRGRPKTVKPEAQPQEAAANTQQ